MEGRTYKYNQSTLTVIFGSILESRTDVIVSSDDCYLSEGGGISRTIAVAGGETVMDECRKMAPVRLGDVAVTSAGKLPQKYIFHCITLSDDEKDRASLFQTVDDYHRYIIVHAVDKCVRLMNALGLYSIAFPCIGAGAAKIPPESFASIMAERLAFHMARTSKEYRIELYLYDHLHRWEPIDYLPVFEKIAVGSAMCMSWKGRAGAEEEDMVVNNVISADSVKMNHQIFISYSRKDIESARQLKVFLDEHGYRRWIDLEGVYSSDSFKDVIAKAIKTCSVMIFLSSVNSNDSEYVAKEISMAVRYKKMVIPLMLDDAPFRDGIELDLQDIDRLDFRSNYEKKLLDNLAWRVGADR